MHRFSPQRFRGRGSGMAEGEREPNPHLEKTIRVRWSRSCPAQSSCGDPCLDPAVSDPWSSFPHTSPVVLAHGDEVVVVAPGWSSSCISDRLVQAALGDKYKDKESTALDLFKECH